MSRHQQTRNRIVVETQSGRHLAAGRSYPPRRKTGEGWIALSVIAAAAVATFIALFITSRPYDPMNSTFDAQQTIPQGPLASPSAKASPSPTPQGAATAAAQETPEPATETPKPPDDAAIQAQIEKSLGSDSALAPLDVSTIVEGGQVTIVGSVRSNELKQRVERNVRSIRGVSAVDNQLVVIESTP